MARFRRHSLLAGVLVTNQLEGTLPAGLFTDAATWQLLEEEHDAALDLRSEFVGPAAAWPAEGGRGTREGRQQLRQSVKAAKFLFGTLPGALTTDTVCTTHRLLMWGAVEDDGRPVAAGQYRGTGVHSGTGYVFPPAQRVPQLLASVVEEYNEARAAGRGACSLAAQLLYGVVTVHPFQNGNGRLCRLLAAYAAMAAGEPFVLALTNGRSMARQHYQQVLRHADTRHTTDRLASFVLECLHRQWQDALTFAGQRQCSSSSGVTCGSGGL